ncbi:MAG: Peptidoglycan glycosyltransferase, partial [Candidatus Saccharibacteria bacterium GW2011_GWA2_46_10]
RLDTRYVVLAKRLSELQKNQIVEQKLPGIGIQAQTYRTYPQNNLAAQLLGFVNDEGKGSYGLEQFYNKELTGTPGLLKAVTDVRGVPLAASKDNIQVDPKAGSDVILTVDLGMQKQLENILKKGLETARSNSGSALIMEVNSGAIKAMANWPSYNPAEYYNVSNSDVFNNAAVSSPLEVGSSMKILTASAALDLGVIKPDTTFYDPGRWDLDGHTITNIEEVGGAATRSIAEVLNQSVNTGATWILMQMGGGDINKQAREHWYDYMTNHFQLGKATGIEQGYEANGYIPDPLSGDALKLTYANTAFGQAMAATPLQMAAALSSIVNGGIYYQPHLVEQVGSQVKQPNVVRTGVVSDAVSSQMRSLMEYVVANHHFARRFGDKYSVGGKTGTAQIANPAGGYYEDKFNGTYIGFVGGDRVQYVIVVRVNDPRIGGYAGAGAAQPIFGDLAHMLIDNFGVVPKK